jgi:hypothetical protein
MTCTKIIAVCSENHTPCRQNLESFIVKLLVRKEPLGFWRLRWSHETVFPAGTGVSLISCTSIPLLWLTHSVFNWQSDPFFFAQEKRPGREADPVHLHFLIRILSIALKKKALWYLYFFTAFYQVPFHRTVEAGCLTAKPTSGRQHWLREDASFSCWVFCSVMVINT